MSIWVSTVPLGPLESNPRSIVVKTFILNLQSKYLLFFFLTSCIGLRKGMDIIQSENLNSFFLNPEPISQALQYLNIQLLRFHIQILLILVGILLEMVLVLKGQYCSTVIFDFI